MRPAQRDDRLNARLIDLTPLSGVRAGSGLAWWGELLVVVQDDAMAIALVDPETRRTRLLPLEGAGAALPKALKPDFEAAFEDASGEIVLVGSGSTDRRRHLARIDPASGKTTIFEAPALYRALAAAIGETPNIEGAIRLGATLRLLHRGAGGSPSVVLEAPWEDGAPSVIHRSWPVDLGTANGVPLTFTDAAPGPDGAMIYLAVAEDTPNAVDDGPIVGLAAGLWTPGAPARWAPVLEADGSLSIRKAEGLALAPDGRSAWIVTDPDDPDRPAELGRLVLEGPWTSGT